MSLCVRAPVLVEDVSSPQGVDRLRVYRSGVSLQETRRRPWRCSAALGIVAMVALGPAAWPQSWKGRLRATGVVTDLEGSPVAGASVALSPSGDADMGPPSVQTDNDGRWVILGLAEGRWRILIKARGFQTSAGWISLSASLPTPWVEVALRSLGEVTPSFGENPTTTARWLEKGNDLLEQGHYEEARAEYEKALRELLPTSQAEVLRAVARTYFMQGNTEATLRTLQRALLLGPEDLTTRQLLTAVMAELGRQAEAEAFLTALERGDDEALRVLVGDLDLGLLNEVAGMATDPPSEIAELAIEPATPGRLGAYRTSFAEKSPYSGLEELLQRLGIERQELEEVDPHGGEFELGQESFHLYVPQGSIPDEGFGVLVWISPGRFGGFSREEVRQLLEERRLIWIGADNAGNQRQRWYRILLALDGVHNLERLYPIDKRRIYASGYSGGGRITSSLVMLYPEVFAGGFSLFGCDYFERIELPDKPGAYWPPRFPSPIHRLRQLREETRFVLLTGELDFNRAQTKSIYRRMLDDGFQHVLYLEIPGASHYHLAAKEWLDRAIGFLDAAITDGPP